MLSTTVFTGVISAFYAFLRYFKSLFAIVSRSQGDLESGLHQNGVIVSVSQATDSSSFHCQGLRDSFVYTGPFVPYPQVASPTKHASTDYPSPSRESLGSQDTSDSQEERGDIGCVSLSLVEPRVVSLIASNVPTNSNILFASVAHPVMLHIANPDEVDSVAELASPCPSLVHTPGSSSTPWAGPPTPNLAAETNEKQSQPSTTTAPKSKSFAENRGYNKFIHLNSVVVARGVERRASASRPDTPFSEIGTSTPLPRYTPTNPEFQRSALDEGQPRAPSYVKSRPEKARGIKHRVVLSHVVAPKATMDTHERLTPLSDGSNLIAPARWPASPPPCSPTMPEPVDTLVAEVLSRLRQECPELTCTDSTGLRPLLLPHNLENRSPSLPASKAPTTTKRPLLLPQHIAERVAFGILPVPAGLPVDGTASVPGAGDDLSVRSMSIYSQASWQGVASSASLACTVGSEVGDLGAFDELDFHPALQKWTPAAHKRRAICMPDVRVPSRL